jgi:hypothetical protein
MAAGKIGLVLGSHAHIPYGADTGEFENVYLNRLRPFVSSLSRYPRIQATLHYSGVLLHWVERSHPELFMLIEDMVSRKQVEMLGGGFYEPLLPIISLQDKIGQIELLTTYLRKQFGKRPQGCWVPAFAWEQGLVSPLASCGMEFTFLSERQFVLAAGDGLGGVRHYAPCICEDQGKLITVFPVLQSMEETLADTSISSLLRSLLDSFNSTHPDQTRLLVSIFPKKISTGRDESMDHAWGRFFEELSLCEDFTETITPGKLHRSLKGLQKLCFSDSPANTDTVSSRRFIIVHPEAGGIYSKMIFTNVLINQLRGDKSRKLSAREELWKSQGSALFRRTGKRGLHNHVLRNAAYSALLGAEGITREKGKFVPSLVSFDFNMDGTDEWLFQDARINCYVQSVGGGIFELDYLPKAWNYLDTSGGRFAFADRLLSSALVLENLKHGVVDGARICHRERYDFIDLDKVHRKLCLLLHRLPGETASEMPSLPEMTPFGCIEIAKTYTLKKDAVCVGYSFLNRGIAEETFQFAPEIDLALPGESNSFTRFFACKSVQADAPLELPFLRGVDGLKIHDLKNEVQITLMANRLFDGRISPVYIPDGETGALLYQAFCLMPLFPLSLKPDESYDLEFTLKFSH